MARGRKSKKKPTRRRSRRGRVSGVGTVDLKSAALVVAGAFAANKLKGILSKNTTNTTMTNLAPFAGLAVGIVLPMVVKGNPLVSALATGMVAAGGIDALRKVAPNLISGVPVIAGQYSAYSGNRLPRPAVNGLGYSPLDNSAYQGGMSVVNGVGLVSPRSAYNPTGSGAANPGY